VFVTLEGTCLISKVSPVDGSVAGEVTPIGTSSTTGTLNFRGSKGKQRIKEINVLNTVVKPELKALGLLPSSEETTETITYTSNVEVM
jgi:hypothetical protein